MLELMMLHLDEDVLKHYVEEVYNTFVFVSPVSVVNVTPFHFYNQQYHIETTLKRNRRAKSEFIKQNVLCEVLKERLAGKTPW